SGSHSRATSPSTSSLLAPVSGQRRSNTFSHLILAIVHPAGGRPGRASAVMVSAGRRGEQSGQGGAGPAGEAGGGVGPHPGPALQIRARGYNRRSVRPRRCAPPSVAPNPRGPAVA